MSSSARRALKILAAVGDAGRPMGVTEIARTLGLAPGTTFRGLDALQGAGLLARHPAAPRYVLGPTALAFRQSLLSLFRIRDVCLPYLRQLASMSGDTSALHVRIGWYVARIATAPGTAEVTSDANLRGAEVLFLHAAGRAILAHLPRKEIARHLAWAAAREIVIPKGVEQELFSIRARGFAVQPAPGGGVTAFPIRQLDQVVASISVDYSGFTGRRPPREWRQVADAVEVLIRANPALANQPFEHFDPSAVLMPS